jgi:transcriptional regulator with XRE-family HTH domain
MIADTPHPVSFCQRVREVMQDLGLKNAQGAHLAGIAPDRLHRISSGENYPKEETLEKIAVGWRLPKHVFFMPRHEAAPFVECAKNILQKDIN